VLFRPSALADPDQLRTLLTRARFADVSVTLEHRSLAYDSYEEYWEGIEAGGGRMGQFYLGLPSNRRRAVREEVERGMARFRSGSRLVLEAEAFIGRGVK
jgi:hypothetical protein